MSIYTSFYVYAYLRKDNTPYYIGKGNSGRAWNKNHTMTIPKNLKRIVILENNLSEIGAFALERRYIRWYGRKDNFTGILRNLTDGGEGSSNRIVGSNERYLKSIRFSGIGNPNFGKKLSVEHKNKLHEKNYLPKSQEHRQKISEGSKNRIKLTCVHCGNISAINMAKRWHFDNCKFKQTNLEQV
jgi:hypothetical protein